MKTQAIPLRIAVGLLFMICTALLATPVKADEDFYLLPQTEAFRFNTEDKFYETRRYSKDFKIKGIEIADNVYFGEARVAGRKGPGLVFEQDNISWGVNHRGAEVLLRF